MVVILPERHTQSIYLFLGGIYMSVLFFILGLLLVIGGFSCIFTPLLTFMSLGYYVVILILVIGIVGVIKSIVEKSFGLNFVFSILSVLLGVVMLAFPGSLLFAEGVMLTMAAIWYVVMGIVTIVDAIKVTKKLGSKLWIPQLIFGILAILIGAYTFFNPMLLAIAQGIQIGVFIIDAGFTLMCSSVVAKN